METTDSVLNEVDKPDVLEIVVKVVADGMFSAKMAGDYMICFDKVRAKATFARSVEPLTFKTTSWVVISWWLVLWSSWVGRRDPLTQILSSPVTRNQVFSREQFGSNGITLQNVIVVGDYFPLSRHPRICWCYPKCLFPTIFNLLLFRSRFFSQELFPSYCLEARMHGRVPVRIFEDGSLL